MKKGAKLGLLGLVAGLGAAGGYAALGNALYDRVMIPQPRSPGWDETDPPAYLEGRAWAVRAEGFRGAGIQSMEGLRLWGAWLPAAEETHRWAILVHGFHDDHASMGSFGRHYHEAGWNILMPDQRGCGHSEGSYVGWGYDERLDLVSWISWVLRRDPKAEILLHGVSMGAATVLMATGGALPKNVKAAISDGSFTTLEAEMSFVASSKSAFGDRFAGIPSWLAFRALRQTALRRAGYDLRRVAPLEAVGRSKTPTLFIHSTEDDVVPTWMLGKLYRAASCPKAFLWVSGSKHAVGVGVAPELYWEAVENFLHTHMP